MATSESMNPLNSNPRIKKPQVDAKLACADKLVSAVISRWKFQPVSPANEGEEQDAGAGAVVVPMAGGEDEE